MTFNIMFFHAHSTAKTGECFSCILTIVLGMCLSQWPWDVHTVKDPPHTHTHRAYSRSNYLSTKSQKIEKRVTGVKHVFLLLLS